MKIKKKNKIFKFLSVFLIISTLFVVFAFPIGALDIGNGSTLTGLNCEVRVGEDNDVLINSYRLEEADDCIFFYISFPSMQHIYSQDFRTRSFYSFS